ncbi:hypothetical protein CMV60_19120 [Serratia marcescens]|nr:hypothetical protein CMV60_19120 [Serratia marcescens]
MGAVGELHIGGVGVALGYLNRPELTAQRFLIDPFNPVGGGRMYRTGDLARYLPDGSLEYQGRCDQQIKLRGFRIEPGEIEVQLAASPWVREAVVQVCSTEHHPRLVAWIVLTADVDRSALQGQLRAYLSERLPEYMVPSAYVWLDALPLTANASWIGVPCRSRSARQSALGSMRRLRGRPKRRWRGYGASCSRLAR